MKNKFDGYTIRARKIMTTKRPDGLIETRALLQGNIEIGIEITPMTWREDWLAKFEFGAAEAGNYRLVNVQNNMGTVEVDSQGTEEDENMVIAVWQKRR